MKSIVLFLCITAFVFAEDAYDTSNIDLNVDEIVGNERLVTSYSKCLTNKGPCTPDIKKLKDILPEVLESRCAKCSDKQKEKGKEMVHKIKSKYPEVWKELVDFYDPQGKYQGVFEELLKS